MVTSTWDNEILRQWLSDGMPTIAEGWVFRQRPPLAGLDAGADEWRIDHSAAWFCMRCGVGALYGQRMHVCSDLTSFGYSRQTGLMRITVTRHAVSHPGGAR